MELFRSHAQISLWSASLAWEALSGLEELALSWDSKPSGRIAAQSAPRHAPQWASFSSELWPGASSRPCWLHHVLFSCGRGDALQEAGLGAAACANANLNQSTPNCIFAGRTCLDPLLCGQLRVLCCVIVSIGMACSCLFRLCSLHDPMKQLNVRISIHLNFHLAD